MKKVCVIFGGMSSEHDVSCVSGATVADSLKKDRYEVILVGITKDGHWLKVDSVDSIRDGSWRKSSVSAVISPDTKGEIIIDSYGNVTREKIDVVVPWAFRRGRNYSGAAHYVGNSLYRLRTSFIRHYHG